MRKNQIQKCSEVKNTCKVYFNFQLGCPQFSDAKIVYNARLAGSASVVIIYVNLTFFSDFCKQGAASSDQEPSHHPRRESDKVQVDQPRNVEALD